MAMCPKEPATLPRVETVFPGGYASPRTICAKRAGYSGMPG